MVKLINIELMKVFRHKSIYVVLMVIFLFCFLNNILYENDYDDDGNYKYETEENIYGQIDDLENELKQYDVNYDNDKNMYITIKSNLDILNIKKDYDSNTWQYIKCNDYLYEDIYNINYYKYIENDKILSKEANNSYQEKILKFKNNDWKYFVLLEKMELESKLDNYKIDISNTYDKEEIHRLEKEKQVLFNDLVIINYRLNKDVSYSNSYLNRALLEYRQNLEYMDKVIDKSNYQDRIQYNDNLAKLNINKYILENKQNINKQNNLNYQLRDIVDDYELFIIIIVLIVCSILIGEEFSKGTIKLLLIKPYSRNKILLSKYIVGILMIIFVIGFVFLSQLLIGGFMFGFDSLDMVVPVYNFNSLKVECFNIFLYMLIRILVKLPLFIIILTISYVLSIFSCNVVLSFSIVIILYMFSEVINNLIVSYNLKFMQYFITLNWNFKDYLFGGLPLYQYMNLKKSVLIWLIYVIILLAMMFVGFFKKNIKNV